MSFRNLLVTGLLALTVGLVTPIYRQPQRTLIFEPPVSQVDGPPILQTLNKFEIAQRQTVLIKTSTGQGSAVVIRRKTVDGNVRWFAFTVAHIVENDKVVEVIKYHRTEGHKAGISLFKARVLVLDTDADLALIIIDAGPDTFLGAEFSSPEPARVGDSVFACGNFSGSAFDGSISQGVISQTGVNPGEGFSWQIVDQTDCAAFPGSSGGPIFNSAGEVIGLVVGGCDSALVWFTPTRLILQFAERNKVRWAIQGEYSPHDVNP